MAKKNKKIYFNFLPLALIPPGGGNALITSTSAGFYTGDKKITHLSTAFFAPYWNFGAQFGLPLRTELWKQGNTWLSQGDFRFLIYPQKTWGLGQGYLENKSLLVNYKYFRFYLNALKRVQPYLYLGFGLDIDNHIHITTADSNLSKYSDYPIGTAEGSNSFSSGPVLTLLFDHRNGYSKILPLSYIHFIYRLNTPVLGSVFKWSSVYLDLRKYVSLNSIPISSNLLAFRSYVWSSLGNNTPYLDLPSIGWDPFERSGRGIEQNRYRGKTLIYFETEYRRDIVKSGLLGLVIFSNLNTVSDPKTNLFSYLHPAAGFGLRVKLSKVTKTNIAMDYGFSKSYSGIWLSIGEAL